MSEQQAPTKTPSQYEPFIKGCAQCWTGCGLFFLAAVIAAVAFLYWLGYVIPTIDIPPPP